ncbi:MAG: 1-deoxy-D-xylulose-5-phosphate reductoisomerase [Lachnospiraceae bacterium]|nr:1-deoxy-D-xylulose-5-phosphate reductoisomerase [Lachnospiraceae bacterium]
MSKRDKVCILGSTGSIGTQTLDVIKTVGDKDIYALACDSNIDKLYLQIKETGCKYACVNNVNKAKELEKKCKINNIRVKICSGMDGLLELVSLKEVDIVVNSVVGMIGIRPTIEAIKNRKILCLANKETLVCAGHIIMPLAKRYGVEIRPIDSEHSAIWQCLNGEKHRAIKKLIITASGGPFYGKTKEELRDASIEDALKHPTWSMGKKITIDSATLVNKGLEVMEAKWLFDIDVDSIDVVVQRESIIHSMVMFNDGAIMAEMSVPSMRIPIAYALYKNERYFINEKELDFSKLDKISIGKSDYDNFPALKLAYNVMKKGGLYPAYYNALDEMAVKKFLDGKIKYIDIVKCIQDGLNMIDGKVA